MKTIVILILSILLTPVQALAQTHMPIIETITEDINTCVDLAGYSLPLTPRVFAPFVMNGQPLAGPQCRIEDTGDYVDGISLASGDKKIILRPDGLLLTTELGATKLSYPLNPDVDLQALANTPMPPGVKEFKLIGVWTLDTAQLEPVSSAQLPDSPVDWRLWRETEMLSETNQIIRDNYEAGLPVILGVGTDERYAVARRTAAHATLGEMCPYMTRYSTYVANILHIFPVIERVAEGQFFDMWAFIVDTDPEIAQECPGTPNYVFIRRDSLLRALPAHVKAEADEKAMSKTRLWHTGLLYEPISGGVPVMADTTVSVAIVGSLIVVGGFAVINEETHVMLMVASP